MANSASLNLIFEDDGKYSSSRSLRAGDRQVAYRRQTYLAADRGEAHCQVRDNLAASPNITSEETNQQDICYKTGWRSCQDGGT